MSDTDDTADSGEDDSTDVTMNGIDVTIEGDEWPSDAILNVATAAAHEANRVFSRRTADEITVEVDGDETDVTYQPPMSAAILHRTVKGTDVSVTSWIAHNSERFKVTYNDINMPLIE